MNERFLAKFFSLCAGLLIGTAHADEPKEVALRDSSFEWDIAKNQLLFNLSFRPLVEAELKPKLSRGLPVTIVLTAAIYALGGSTPLSTTAQTCKVTWHVWEEAFRLEITRPGGTQVRWTATVEGVLRRCAETQRLLAAENFSLMAGPALFSNGKIQINPVSPEVLSKIRRWVLRPSATATVAPGDALFGTFTGLFLQRIGNAEREFKFTTPALLPLALPLPPHPPAGAAPPSP